MKKITEKETGVNFDYVVAIEKNNQAYSVVRIPIVRSNDVIDGLISIAKANDTNIVDMQNYIRSKRCTTGYSFESCLKYHYYDSYIDDIYIEDFNASEYLKWMRYKEAGIQAALAKGYERYASQLKAKFFNEIEENKQIYLKDILGYLYAFDYNNAVKKQHLLDKFLIYSAERPGIQTYEIQISDDISISIHTNFCYGRSSHFHLIIKYKGINITPYTEWVKYYYAQENQILAFTRSYICDRENWENCFEFVADFINAIEKEGEQFVLGEIQNELNELIKGLDQIFRLSDNEYRKRLEVDKIPEDDTRYIGISSARHSFQKDRDYYKIRPDESKLIFRIEKIAGAIKFIEAISKYEDSIGETVRMSIKKIKELNRQILPEIAEALPAIISEKAVLEKELKKITQECEQKVRHFNSLEVKLEKFIKQLLNKDRKERIKEFEIKHPEYRIVEKERNELMNRQCKLEEQIRERQKIIERLNQYKGMIKNTIEQENE